VVLNWGASINFQGGASPYAFYSMESLINKFTNKYIGFDSFLKSGGLQTKDNYLREAWQKKVKNHCSRGRFLGSSPNITRG